MSCYIDLHGIGLFMTNFIYFVCALLSFSRIADAASVDSDQKKFVEYFAECPNIKEKYQEHKFALESESIKNDEFFKNNRLEAMNLIRENINNPLIADHDLSKVVENRPKPKKKRKRDDEKELAETISQKVLLKRLLIAKDIKQHILYENSITFADLQENHEIEESLLSQDLKWLIDEEYLSQAQYDYIETSKRQITAHHFVCAEFEYDKRLGPYSIRVIEDKVKNIKSQETRNRQREIEQDKVIAHKEEWKNMPSDKKKAIVKRNNENKKESKKYWSSERKREEREKKASRERKRLEDPDKRKRQNQSSNKWRANRTDEQKERDRLRQKKWREEHPERVKQYKEKYKLEKRTNTGEEENSESSEDQKPKKKKRKLSN